ncbi:hypothetical protein Hanom_Chr16g01432831 [Helianthus anomalus]
MYLGRFFGLRGSRRPVIAVKSSSNSRRESATENFSRSLFSPLTVPVTATVTGDLLPSFLAGEELGFRSSPFLAGDLHAARLVLKFHGFSAGEVDVVAGTVADAGKLPLRIASFIFPTSV